MGLTAADVGAVLSAGAGQLFSLSTALGALARLALWSNT